MNRFFQDLEQRGLLKDYTIVFDWLLDDNKFSAEFWDSNYLRLFTKSIQKISHFQKDNKRYTYGSMSSIEFLSPKTTRCNPTVQIAKKDGEGKDIIRHFRNGIAHGNAKVKIYKSALHIQLVDYNARMEQTAFIFIPMSALTELFMTYRTVEKAKRNNKKKVTAQHRSKKE